MHVLMVSCVFPPEPVASAHTSADLAQALCSKGYDVQVITAFPNRHVGKLFTGYKQKLFMRERHSTGYKILRCFSFLSPQSSLASRFLENFSFGVVSGVAVMFLERPDVVYANTWPIFAQGILALVCWMRGIPLVFSVQDLYPESLLVQSRINGKTSWIIRLLRWVDARVVNSAAALIVISEKFKQAYIQDRALPVEKILVIPNWIDVNQFEPDSDGSQIRARHGISNSAFLAIYAGNVGVAAGVENLVKSWQSFSSAAAPFLLVAGSGSQMELIMRLARDSQASQVYFHTPWLEAETSPVLAAADLLILPTQGSQSMVSVPSKLLTYMLAARPMLALALQGSDVEEIILSAGCGWVIPPDAPRLLQEEILHISRLDRDELTRRGQNGRAFVLKHYSLQENLPKVIKILQQAGGGT